MVSLNIGEDSLLRRLLNSLANGVEYIASKIGEACRSTASFFRYLKTNLGAALKYNSVTDMTEEEIVSSQSQIIYDDITGESFSTYPSPIAGVNFAVVDYHAKLTDADVKRALGVDHVIIIRAAKKDNVS